MNTHIESPQAELARDLPTQKASAISPPSTKGEKISKELPQDHTPADVLMGSCTHCIPLASYTDYELLEDFINQE